MCVQSQESPNANFLSGLMLKETQEVQKEGLVVGEAGVEDEVVQVEGGEEEEALLLEDVGAHLAVEEEVVSKSLLFTEN